MNYTKLVEVAHSEIASYGCIDSANSQAMIEAIESQAKRIAELEAQPAQSVLEMIRHEFNSRGLLNTVADRDDLIMRVREILATAPKPA